jgi:hypothetical protein
MSNLLLEGLEIIYVSSLQEMIDHLSGKRITNPIYKVINRNSHYLNDFIIYSMDKMVSPLAKKNGHYYFFAKSRNLPKVFNYSTYNKNMFKMILIMEVKYNRKKDLPAKFLHHLNKGKYFFWAYIFFYKSY